MMEPTEQNKQQSVSITKILPVFLGFFIMGLVDLIGVVSNYVKSDFSISDSLVNLISLSCFFWFLVISIPAGFLMNRIGRKNTVLLSYFFTFVGLFIPWLNYSFSFVLLAFAFIGIGNAIVQVALNPLVTNVVSKEKLTGSLTLGQFVKAISSFLGPIVASWFASSFLDWKLLFPMYALTTLLSGFWLWLTPICQEQIDKKKVVSFKETLSLLKDKRILVLFIGILVLVGVDVGINITLPKYLMENYGLELNKAVLGNSVYFLVRTVSAFIGGIVLMKYSKYKFYKYSVLIAFAGFLCLLFPISLIQLMAGVVIFGIGYANLFAILFSIALQLVPRKANEVSSLLIVGVSGGAIVTPLLGVSSDIFNTQLAAIIILSILWLYMLWLIKSIKKDS
ncbi:MAG: MFS transporter [Massilibacteroides sp.]|nr:MFS transporter [Massilibacteroides sp.]